MNRYKILSCPDYDRINAKILAWIQDRKEILESKNFWNAIDHRQFLRQNEEFMHWCLSGDLKVCAIAVTVGRGPDCCSVHIDTQPARYKLSWPVLNTKHTYNRWFDVLTEEPVVTINSLGGRIFHDPSQLREIDRMELLSPCLIDAGIPHDVYAEPQAQFPRLGLQCQLFNEPQHL